MMVPLVVLLVSLSTVLSAPSLDPKLDQHWDQWKTWNSKAYHESEDGWRRMIWEKNLRKIQLHNLEHAMGKHSYRLAMNHYGDLSTQEFWQVMSGYRNEAQRKATGSMFLEPNFLNVPKAVDWRKMGYVTPIKDQGHCGSCWAFSTTGALEGQHFRKTGKLVSLSEQNLIDCSRPEGNDGCHGGMIDAALQYVMNNQGLDSEESYPYQGTDNSPCRYDRKNKAANETSFVKIPSGDEVALMKAVAAVGPVSVAIDTSQDTFQFYSSGIYYEKECSSTILDHAVLVVGYGYEGEHEDGRKYWIVKNSWGSHWGQKGYVYMAKDMNNHCGIATEPIYPLV